MGRPSRHSEEFRREAVELYRPGDRPRAEVARSFGISDGSLAAWVKQARPEAESFRHSGIGRPCITATRNRSRFVSPAR